MPSSAIKSIAMSFGPAGQSSRAVPVIDPKMLYKQCLGQGIPTQEWLGKANGLLNPLGEGPARGMVLLTREHLDDIGKEGLHDLTFKTDDVTVLCRNVQILTAKAVDPSSSGNPNTCYYAEIVDQRHNFNRKMVGRRFNMVTADGMEYQPASINGDDPWTWRELLEELWAASVGSVSAVPTLTPVPHGTPENFDFQQDYALHALCVFLDRIGWALRWTPWDAATPYDIVQIGAELAAADDLESGANEETFIWDDYPLKATKTSVPAKVAVLFRAFPQDCNDERFCIVEVPRQPGNYNNEQRETDTTFITHDDLIARRFTGSGSNPFAGCGSGSESGCSGITGCCNYINETDLHERACERAEDYYRMLTRAGDPWQRVYSGAKQLRPQSRYKAVHWQEWGQGMKTTVYRGIDLLPPFALWEAWYATLEFNCGSGGSGSMSGANVSFNFCSVVGPDCVIALSSQQCCNTTNGYYSIPIYMVVAAGGVHMFIDSENRDAAIQFATDNGLSGCILGECPEA